MKKKSLIFDCLKEAKSLLIVSHYHPDGDAIGSALALALGLKQLKKEVAVYNRDSVPHNLVFLPASQSVEQKLPGKKFDVAVMVDCAQPKRISTEFDAAVQAKKFSKLVCIDHHLLDHPVGDIDWVEPNAASTGCVIWEILKMLNVELTKDIANLIFCTLTVDTGSFKYSNTTVQTFQLAGELVSHGADPWLIAKNIEESNPIERFRLLGLSLQTLYVALNGKFASMDVTRAMLKQAGAREDLSEEFGNIPRSIEGVEVAVLFREMEDSKIKVSLRSKDIVDVANVAKTFGGGGHEHAAGCVLACSLTEAKKQIEAAVKKSLK